ncbi:MAG TPA: lipopolysaccharide heptosyltransferase I [Verrucomicrobiae bacterium]
MRVLLIKMSSLGDVVHTLAPLTDAAAANPGIRFDWVVEEGYKEIPKWHPSVDRVIVAPLRRWRKAPFRTVRSGEWNRFRSELRSANYDLVFDAQGLMKSAFVARQSGQPITGRSRESVREAAASFLYTHKIDVDLRLTEVEQLRQLFARTLGYEQPHTPADFGIDRNQFQIATHEPYAVFFHGAAWPAKLWSQENWIALGKHIRAAGLALKLAWGTDDERKRAQCIVDAVGGTVMPKLSVGELARMIANAKFAVGLDTGLTHVAIALGVPTVTMYGPSAPMLHEVKNRNLIDICSVNSTEYDASRPNTVPLPKVLAAIQPWLANHHASQSLR